MSKKILTILLLAVASLFVSCGSKDDAKTANTQVAMPKPKPILDKVPFTAPAKSTITIEKANFYAKASNGLVELAIKWSERIDKAKDFEKVQILNAYNVARDQLCIRAGLKSGIDEYNWITNVAMKNPENKSVFEKAGFKIK